MIRDLRNGVADGLYAHYQRADRSPPLWASRTTVAVAGQDSDRTSGLNLRLEALRLPVSPLGDRSAQPLELLVVVAPKDFDILPLSLEGAFANSGHPISRASLIVPASGLREATLIAERFSDRTRVSVLCEDDVISESLREKLRERFTTRYGWILQQLLCVAYVSASEAVGVLLMDADTVLVRPRAFLQGNRQLLMASLEQHAPYYAFLRSLHPMLNETGHSFVTHHMVQQPEFMAQVLELTCESQISVLVDHLLAYANASAESSVCVDFELYAQTALKLEPDRIALAKWCNASAKRSPTVLGASLAELSMTYANYYSVSFHSYI
jgi:hypothetical protein